MENKKIPEKIQIYFDKFSPTQQEKLKEIRQIILAVAPNETTEKISYQMPAFHFQGNLVYYGGAKKHLGFYPTSSPIVAFEKELTPYKTSKGAIQFSWNKPLPTELIQKIVQFRVQEQLEK